MNRPWAPLVGVAAFSGSAEDRDGHVTRFDLDLGDGSAPRLLAAYRQGPCQQTSHRYAEPGSCTATLTAYSYGCDRKHEQTGTATYTYTW